MLTLDENEGKRIKTGFQKILDRHGYGFHYSVLNRASELHRASKSPWIFEAAEFPVEVRGHGTRIDFLLTAYERLYMIAECKRANPVLTNWCFLRAPMTMRNERKTTIPLEHVYLDRGNRVYASGHSYSASNSYNIALEVRSDEKGESGAGRGAIEDAATQVCRGMSGLTDFLMRYSYIVGDGLTLIPVIFTTASLWTSNVDLATSELSTGKVDLEGTRFHRTPWLFYQYHLSPGLKHKATDERKLNSIGKIMESEYVRTIAVVNAAGIEDFLTWPNFSDWAEASHPIPENL